MYRYRGVEFRDFVTQHPFVLLTDTFTGKFLCDRDVRGGHFLLKIIPQLGTLLISIRSSNISPHMGTDIIF